MPNTLTFTPKTQAEIEAFLRTYHLSPTADAAFDYDVLMGLLAEREDEQFDVFVRLAYSISVMKLTLDELKRAKQLIQRLAWDVLEFNLQQADLPETNELLEKIE